MESKIIKLLKRAIDNNDNSGINEFWSMVNKNGAPIIEEIDGVLDYSLISFIYIGNDKTTNVLIYGGVPGYRYSENIMDKIEGTNIFYKTYKVRNDIKFKYNFSLNYEGDNDYKKIKGNSIIDPLNPNKVILCKDDEDKDDEDSISSFAKLPNCKGDFWTKERDDIEKGKLFLDRVYSNILNNDRRVWVYTPSGYSNKEKPYKLLVLTDGFDYINYLSIKNVLDNLISDKKIDPIVCVLVSSNDNRYEELTCNEKFADFITLEILPWINSNYNVDITPQNHIIGGVSLGGLTASYIGYKYSNYFGNILSQSGSFWYEKEWLTEQYKNSEKLPLKFYLCAGLLEDYPYDDEPVMMEVINNMRDILLEKGYDVTYETFNSGHDYLGWGETLASGLISLIGK